MHAPESTHILPTQVPEDKQGFCCFDGPMGELPEGKQHRHRNCLVTFGRLGEQKAHRHEALQHTGPTEDFFRFVGPGIQQHGGQGRQKTPCTPPPRTLSHMPPQVPEDKQGFCCFDGPMEELPEGKQHRHHRCHVPFGRLGEQTAHPAYAAWLREEHFSTPAQIEARVHCFGGSEAFVNPGPTEDFFWFGAISKVGS